MGRARSSGRLIGRWLGLFLVIAGLAVAGYVGWAVYGTTWVSHRTQAKVVRQVQATWASSDRSTDSASAVTTSAGEATALVRIPRFGIGYVMPVLEGTSATVLSAGIGHYVGTAGPGAVGNYALAAHRITHGEPFRQLPDLRKGDLVYVGTADRTYVYTMLTGGDDLTVGTTDAWVLAPDPDNPEPGGVEPPQRPGQHLITLTTCADLFHSDNRLVAFGELTSTQDPP